jgi:predicted GIY-YIG superfamily endonuclease
MADKQGYVYILECEHSCWYVGYSQDISVRIASHFLGAGSLWTQAHKPISVFSVQKGDTTLETCQTIALMCKHGFEKVRGGRYTCTVMKRPACISKALHYAAYKTPKSIADTTGEDSGDRL